MKQRLFAILCASLLLLTGVGGVSAANNKEDNMDKRAQATTTSMKLSGYLDEMVNGNIANWALTALEKNPNIIEEIEKATADTVTLGSLLADPFWQISSGLISVTMAENKGYKGDAAFAITSLKTGTYGDNDYKIAQLPGTRLDWRGAEEVWFHVDASAFSDQPTRIGFAIQEKNTVNGALTGNFESWGLRAGETVHLYDERTGTWTDTEAVDSTVSNGLNTGRVTIPAGFKGWIAIPLDTQTLSAYWSSAGYNYTLDLMDVNQFQICVEGNSGSIGNTIYLSAFSIAGTGFGGALPVSGRLAGATFTQVVPLKDLRPALDSYTGSIVAWYSEFPGKLLTGLAYNYRLSPTAELKAAGDRLTKALKDAQADDGYLGVFKGNNILGGAGSNWDVWGHYHSIYGLLYWYRATGNADALTTARKAADKVYDYFVGSGRSFDSAGSQTMNLGISHGFAELYKETGTQNYLDAAVQIVEEEWPKSGDWMNAVLNGKDFYQTSLPRWEALHTVMTLGTLWELTGTEKYYTALETIWWSIAKTDRHNTGGFSSGETACGDPYNTGVIETCCTVAWMGLSTEYLQLSRNSIVADELELSYYNAMLGSLLNGERLVTYNTPMQGEARKSSQTDIAFQYNSGSPDFNCCQANVSRGLGELSQWAVLTDSQTLYLNFYGETTMAVTTPSGQALTITQKTAYPLNGAVTITLSGIKKAENFRLALRIPSWAGTGSVTVDGRTTAVSGGSYHLIDRTWTNGDTVVLNIGMTIHTWVHEKDSVEASVYYGPILLATESAFLANSSVSWSSMKAVKVAAAQDGRHWIKATLTVDGVERTLYDFASIGKFSQYSTWFLVTNLPERMTPVKGAVPIWCNKTGDDTVNDPETTTMEGGSASTTDPAIDPTTGKNDPTTTTERSHTAAGGAKGWLLPAIGALCGVLVAVGLTVFGIRKRKARG